MQTAPEIAAALIGTKSVPPGLPLLRERAAEAWAYHRLAPYPFYHFKDWQTEDRGPLPRCLPFAKSIVQRGARFLFGKPLQLMCAGNSAWETFLREAWTENAMGARLVPIAVKAALESGIALKFAYDETNQGKPLSIQSLSVVDQVRLFYHPHDVDLLLMARVQYRYFDPAQNQTFWYREEWTAEEEAHYAPLPDSSGTSQFNPDTSDAWIMDSRETNPFGVIPLHYIKNQESDDSFGLLDLQDVYRVVDNIHLTYHLMNRSNQFDADTNPIFIDADLDEQDIDRPLQPGQPVDLQSKEGQEHQAKVQFPSGGNALRPAMMEYARDLKAQVLAAAGSVEVNLADISHMGNMTRAVLTQTYLPLLEMTEEKRKSWGESGLIAFFSLVAKGLKNAGAQLGITGDADSCAVTIQWPEHFELSEDEKAARTGRIQEQELAGYVTHDRAIEEIAPMEGRTDVEALKGELAAEAAAKAKLAAATPTATDPSAAPGDQDPSLANTEMEIKGLVKMGGDSSK